jgi:hypothetical protein
MDQAHLIYSDDQSRKEFRYITGMEWDVVETVQTGSYSLSHRSNNYGKVVG